MENIKALLGSAYHEGVTVEEINSFLAGKTMVNLKEGGYVSKEKLDRIEADKKQLQADYDTLKEQTKDYEALKNENDGFKTEKANAELKSKILKLGIKESSFKYVKGDIDSKELVLGDDDKANADSVKKYLESHPEFAEKPQPQASQTKTVVLSTRNENTDNGGKPNEKEIHDNINTSLRSALGYGEK